MKVNKLVLFDIDKTLIEGSKSQRIAFSEAFKKVYGVDTTIDVINHEGTTDQQIIIEVLKKNGLKEEVIKSKIKQCMKVMVKCFEKNIRKEKIIVLEGVRELLEELNKHNFLMGLVTGNLEPIARGKLMKVNLNHYFKFGGFGNENINRTNLIKLAIKKAKENFAFESDNNIFLFGDTPRDINAGKKVGVKTIGVATGIHSIKQLKNAGADFVLKNLKDINKILKIMGGARTSSVLALNE
jgi:phosphoglycolate phosphatase-like HAD superfamily hydrolase